MLLSKKARHLIDTNAVTAKPTVYGFTQRRNNFILFNMIFKIFLYISGLIVTNKLIYTFGSIFLCAYGYR
ncbi:hypothetical protein D210916BOD24_12820 [Alteromonas sp. D210916BOD_24]